MLPTPALLGFSGGSDSKESACNVGDLGFIPGLGRFPGGGHGNPLQYSGLENPCGQRSLAGCNPWDCKESDTTERVTQLCPNLCNTYICLYIYINMMATHSSILAWRIPWTDESGRLQSMRSQRVGQE